MWKGDFSAFKKCNYVALVFSFINHQFAKKKEKTEKPSNVICQRDLSLQPIKIKIFPVLPIRCMQKSRDLSALCTRHICFEF